MTNQRIRRVIVRASGVDVDDVEAPIPARGEALLAPRAIGVCGSDLHAVRGRHPFIALPYAPGHEVVAEVRAVGDDVSADLVGRRVVVEPTLPCWSCKMCTTGRENLCENLQFFGCGYEQGGMAELCTVPADRLHVIPDALDDTAAALIEPLSTPVHAVRLAGGVHGKAVVILGAGTIGLLLLAAVRSQAPKRVVVTDMLAAKRDKAVRLGADSVVDAGDGDYVAQVRRELGESADVVFDCVAVQPTVSAAIALADKGGTVVVVGVPGADVVVPLAVMQDHQIRLQGSATYLPADYADAMTLLRDGRLPVDELVTARVPFDRAAEAFELAAGGEHVKVLVTTG